MDDEYEVGGVEGTPEYKAMADKLFPSMKEIKPNYMAELSFASQGEQKLSQSEQIQEAPRKDESAWSKDEYDKQQEQAYQELSQADKQLHDEFTKYYDEAYQQQAEQWREQSLKMFSQAEIGEAQSVGKYFDPELKHILNSTGYGNHASVIRTMRNIARAVRGRK